MKANSIFVVGGVLILGAALQIANAQNAAPANPAPAATSSDATRLPGDNPPPSGMMAGPPPGAANAGGKPPPEAGTDAPGPSLSLAIEAAQAAIAACAADGYKVGVSVIDSTGQPRVALSADGATGGHVYTGVRKAIAALAFKAPTSEVAAKIATDKDMASQVKPNMATMAGAVPLLAGSNVIGAIGVSGASSQQDEKCAAAGAAKIKGRLK